MRSMVLMLQGCHNPSSFALHRFCQSRTKDASSEPDSYTKTFAFRVHLAGALYKYRLIGLIIIITVNVKINLQVVL